MDAPQRRRRPRALLAGSVALAAAAAVAVLVAMTAVPATPGSGPSATASGADPVIAAAGDVACDPTSRSFRGGEGSGEVCRQRAVSDLLVDAGLAAVLALGDLQYYCGSEAAFRASYDRSWGRVKDITRPVPGNHEYIDKPKDGGGATACDAGNQGARGYFAYFGAAAHEATQGYYSFDVGAWHLVALNSNCSAAGGCRAGSPQLDWLRADLAAHPQACTLAFLHHPRFSSGEHGSDPDYAPLWEVLHAAGVEVVLNGHEHIYERFAPQTPDGALDEATGIRQFTVGTGGANHTEVRTVAPHSEVREATAFGVLTMTLRPDGYDWKFVPTQGDTFTDTGTGRCHGPRENP